MRSRAQPCAAPVAERAHRALPIAAPIVHFGATCKPQGNLFTQITAMTSSSVISELGLSRWEIRFAA